MDEVGAPGGRALAERGLDLIETCGNGFGLEARTAIETDQTCRSRGDDHPGCGDAACHFSNDIGETAAMRACEGVVAEPFGIDGAFGLLCRAVQVGCARLNLHGWAAVAIGIPVLNPHSPAIPLLVATRD